MRNNRVSQLSTHSGGSAAFHQKAPASSGCTPAVSFQLQFPLASSPDRTEAVELASSLSSTSYFARFRTAGSKLGQLLQACTGTRACVTHASRMRHARIYARVLTRGVLMSGLCLAVFHKLFPFFALGYASDSTPNRGGTPQKLVFTFFPFPFRPTARQVRWVRNCVRISPCSLTRTKMIVISYDHVILGCIPETISALSA